MTGPRQNRPTARRIPIPGALRLALLGLALLGACASPREARLLILHTNDIHARIERRDDSLGAAEISGAIAHARRHEGEVLVLDAGDFVAGTALSSLTKGRAPLSVMARMGYDAMALGNHELDHGWRLVAGYRDLLPFPLLCANAFAPDGSLLADATHEVFVRGPLRVAVVGVLEEDALEHTIREGNEGVVVRPPEEVLRRLLPRLREDVDLVVVLSHCGLAVDRRLAREVEGIDVIVGGHSHDRLEAPERVGDTWIVHAGSYLRALGRLEVVVDLREGRIREATGTLTRPASPVHPEVSAAVQDLARDLAPRLDRVIGRTERPVSRADLQASIETVYRRRLGTDLAFHNPGGVRAALPAGPITVRRIWQALPFDNTLVRMSIRGADLPAFLRERLGTAPVPDRVYTVATNSYVAQQQEKYFKRTGIPVEDTGLPMRETFLEAVEAGSGLPR